MTIVVSPGGIPIHCETEEQACHVRAWGEWVRRERAARQELARQRRLLWQQGRCGVVLESKRLGPHGILCSGKITHSGACPYGHVRP